MDERYWKEFTSNTYAGSGNQLYFRMDENEVRTGRIFYQIAAAGTYRYSLLFSNVIDSTFADGSVSRHDLPCGGWRILEARIGRCAFLCTGDSVLRMTMAEDAAPNAVSVADWRPVSFQGRREKDVLPGEFFCSDPVTLHFEAGEFLCLEMTFSGRLLPYHEETLLPVFIKTPNGWKYARSMPCAGMVGCDRRVRGRIAYLGDSITQGIGTPLNSYENWAAKLAEKLGGEYAHWNLGLGCGRASDAAADGAWLRKARQNDAVIVCFGVNDILNGASEEQVERDLTRIVETLRRAGKKVLVQTVPPFDYKGEAIRTWSGVNRYVKTVLRHTADAVFDTVPFLCESEAAPHLAKFGGHPNAEGCAVWADALYEFLCGLDGFLPDAARSPQSL